MLRFCQTLFFVSLYQVLLDFLVAHGVLESLLNVFGIVFMLLLTLILLHVTRQSVLIKAHSKAIGYGLSTAAVLLLLDAVSHG